MPSASSSHPREDNPQLSDASLPSYSLSKQSRAQTKGGLETQKSNTSVDNEDDGTSTEPTSSSGSSINSSSDDDGDDNDDEQENREEAGKQNGEEGIHTVPSRMKPRIHRIEKNNDILNRITAFLPQMKNANEDLQRELAAGRGRDMQVDGASEEGEGEDEGRYIEMNLGLGVLEEKRPGDEDHEMDTDTGDEGDNEEEHKQHSKTQTNLPSRPKDSSVLEKLMGKKEDEPKKPSIEEMND